MGTRLWVVRHAESEWNAAQRFCGWTDVPLTPSGRRQARALRPLLRKHTFDGVWSSDLIRAIETARLAYGEPVQDPRLREIDFGEMEGAKWEELSSSLRQTLKNFDRFSAPGGESMEGLWVRVFEFCDELIEGQHLIFTHGGVVRLLSRHSGGSDDFSDNASILKLDWTGTRELETE